MLDDSNKLLPGSEIVGARRATQVGYLSDALLTQLWTKTTSAVIKRGFILEYRDLEPPRTGIFDGLRIVIDPDVPFEMQCFILLHLFGHSVQWVAPSLTHKLNALQHTLEKEPSCKSCGTMSMRPPRLACASCMMPAFTI